MVARHLSGVFALGHGTQEDVGTRNALKHFGEIFRSGFGTRKLPVGVLPEQVTRGLRDVVDVCGGVDRHREVAFDAVACAHSVRFRDAFGDLLDRRHELFARGGAEGTQRDFDSRGGRDDVRG